jgi:hypothetical protein
MCISIEIEDTRHCCKDEDWRARDTAQRAERYLTRSKSTEKNFVRCSYTTGCFTTDSVQQMRSDLQRGGADNLDCWSDEWLRMATLWGSCACRCAERIGF